MQEVVSESPARQGAARSHRGVAAPQITPAEPGRCPKQRGGWIAPLVLIAALVLAGAVLALWKMRAAGIAASAAANQPEPVEAVTVAVARPQEHRRTTTSIGTLVATRSITLRNELPGTVREVSFTPGQIVEAGTVLVALDVSVEQAELQAQEAQAALAETLLSRMERAVQHRATSQMELDRARAERDVARAQIARARAIIDRKTIRAPFRARVGLADIHPGQYLEEGVLLTTLQGVDPGVFVDFTVTQQVAQTLKENTPVEILAGASSQPITAQIHALDSRTDSNTRNTWIRARIEDARGLPSPGASVRVRVPVGEPVTAVAIPVSALRKGPAGDHVFVISPDEAGKSRAHPRPVQSGPLLGDTVLVLSGLNAGEQVAASGSFKLREGVLVAATPASPLEVAATNGVRQPVN
jgi:RND family efflux transporter MFP subunit